MVQAWPRPRALSKPIHPPSGIPVASAHKGQALDHPRGVDHNARIYDLLENYVLPAVLPEAVMR